MADKPAQTSVPDPTSLASSLGAARSSWWKLGDGPWYGNVTDVHGMEHEVEELSSSWRSVSQAQTVFTAKTLELLLKKVLK
jgi:hypothetical protein